MGDGEQDEIVPFFFRFLLFSYLLSAEQSRAGSIPNSMI